MQVTYLNHGGTDLDVVNAARVSFNNRSDWETITKQGVDDDILLGQIPYSYEVKALKSKDVRLIEYLARGMSRSEWEDAIVKIAYGNLYYKGVEPIVESLMNMAQHWVPFTHNIVTLHMVAPVPIARQCFKHKIGFTESEESRRYVSTTPTLYVPPSFRSAASNVKQGSGGDHPFSDRFKTRYETVCNEAIKEYDIMIANGVAPEQARFILPQGCEVQWIWSGNIAAYARYVNQRSDPHAQLESRELAHKVSNIIEPLFPVSWPALVKSGRKDE